MVKRSVDVDVSIVGGGPAGYFAALKLNECCPNLKIAIFEKGGLREREDPNIISGWGGAGTFSDGKLILSPEVGGWLGDFIEEKRLLEVMDYVENTYLRFGFPKEKVFGIEPIEKIEELRIRVRKAHLELKPYKIRHAGTDGIYQVTKNIYQYLRGAGIKIYLNTPVKHVLKSEGKLELELEDSKKIRSSFVVLAPGRGGADWLRREAENLKLSFIETKKVGVDVGWRAEVPFEILQEFTDLFHEFKIEKDTKCFDDNVRTFCICPRGQVKIERKDGLAIINGHGYINPKKWSKNTNFAVLVKANFTEPFRDSIGYALDIVRMANKLGGGKPLIQRLGDLKEGRRSTWEKINRGNIESTLKEVEPGDLSYALPYRIICNLLEFFESLEPIFPGLNDKHTLLYGAEIKLYSNRPETREGFETMVEGLYVGGDGSGYSRSITHAACTGVIIAEHIAKRV